MAIFFRHDQVQEFEFSYLHAVWAWFGTLIQVDFTPQRFWPRPIIGRDMVILIFFAYFQLFCQKIDFCDLDPNF